MASDSSGTTIINFLLLAAIRGTTPLMSYFAVTRLNSASLVVAFKCAIALILFSFSIIVMLLSSEEQIRTQIRANFRAKSTYWKLLVIGIIQGTAPYLFVIKSLEYLPPTLMAVFMVATPWFTILFERAPFVKVKTRMTSIVIMGMTLGFIGICLTTGPAIHESLANCQDTEAYIINGTNFTGERKDTRTFSSDYPYDVCLPGDKVAIGMLCLFAASFLWASSTIFWRAYKNDIHFTVASMGQNVVGTFICFGIWLAFEKTRVVGEVYWQSTLGIVGFVFLGVCSSWLATHLVQLLCKSMGPKSTNQVLVALPVIAFIEDCVFVKDVITIHPWVIAMEVIGLMLISLGTLLTNLPLGKRRKGQGPLTETLLDASATEGLTGYDYHEHTSEVSRYEVLHDSDGESTEEKDEEEITTRKASEGELRNCSGGVVI